MESDTASKPAQTPTPFDALLLQCRDIFCARTPEAVTRMLGKANDSLSALATKSSDREAQKALLEARDLAVTQHGQVEAQFRKRLASEFQSRANKAKKIGQVFAEIDSRTFSLELVAEDDLDETLRYNNLAARIRGHCDAELAALEQRVGVLVGDAGLQGEDNPFSTNAICDAYKQSWRQVESTPQQRAVLLALFDDEFFDDLDAMYEELNELLVANSILPKIRYGVKKEGRAARRAASAAGEAPAAAAGEAPSPAREAEGDVFGMLQKMLGGAAAAMPPAPSLPEGMVAVPLDAAALLSSLTQLQLGNLAAMAGPGGGELPESFGQGSGMNMLRDLKATPVGAGLGQMDSMTLDIVAMLFDELFDDPKIPVVMKGMVARLQIPMLKVAIADKALFSKKSHPARQLLDTLGQIAVRLPPTFDASSPIFEPLEKFIEDLVERFQEKLEVFDEVRAQLEGLLAEDDKRVAQEMESSSKQLQQAEKLALATAAAQEAISSRVMQAPAAPRVIVDFLAQHWIKYLVITHAKEGGESEAWKAALEIIDQLLWSVQPKETPDDRRKLAGTIPSLLKGVRMGAALAGVDDSASSAFFAGLMQCHAEVMHPPPKEKPRRSRGEKAAPPPPPPPEPVALDFTAPVTIDNPFGEGQVEVTADDLDFTATPVQAHAGQETSIALEAPAPSAPAAGHPARGARTVIPLPARMAEGAWVDIADEQGDAKPARLYYVSPMRSHFLFVDRRGAKVYECSRSMLARRLNAGEITMLDGEPDASLFDRIMQGLFGKLGTSAPAPAA